MGPMDPMGIIQWVNGYYPLGAKGYPMGIIQWVNGYPMGQRVLCNGSNGSNGYYAMGPMGPMGIIQWVQWVLSNGSTGIIQWVHCKKLLLILQ